MYEIISIRSTHPDGCRETRESPVFVIDHVDVSPALCLLYDGMLHHLQFPLELLLSCKTIYKELLGEFYHGNVFNMSINDHRMEHPEEWTFNVDERQLHCFLRSIQDNRPSLTPHNIFARFLYRIGTFNAFHIRNLELGFELGMDEDEEMPIAPFFNDMLYSTDLALRLIKSYISQLQNLALVFVTNIDIMYGATLCSDSTVRKFENKLLVLLKHHIPILKRWQHFVVEGKARESDGWVGIRQLEKGVKRDENWRIAEGSFGHTVEGKFWYLLATWRLYGIDTDSP